MLRKTKQIHIIGIGGIGMSGIAAILLKEGFTITGSDMRLNENCQYLLEKGAQITQGHDATLIHKDLDVVVISSAIKQDNPEVITAKNLNIPVIKRAEMLSELMRMRFGIGVAGTHGKTTTTSMVGHILNYAKLSPTIIVGGIVKNIGTNSQIGQGDCIVVEADEYDRTFLSLNPILAGITNIELEHLDCYKDLDAVKEAFVQFANSVPFFGLVAVCLEDENIKDILPRISKKIVTYGFSRQANLRAENIKFHKAFTCFDLYHHNQLLGEIQTNLVGQHNVLNTLLAILLSMEMDLDFDTIKKALQEFSGVKRRLEKVGFAKGILVFDDYAHHPTEIKTTLKGVRNTTDGRIVALFQPHLYSRTRDFAEEFGKSFMDADIVLVTPIYPAREPKIEGVDNSLITDAAIRCNHQGVHKIESNQEIIKATLDILQPEDILITFGAGDIYQYGKEILSNLEQSKATSK